MYREEQVIGYIFDHDGRYDNKYYFKGTTENIASFIFNNASSCTMVTDSLDNLVVKSKFYGRYDLLTTLRKVFISSL